MREFSDALSKASYTVNYMNSAGEAVSKTFDTTNFYFAGLYDPPEGVTVLGGKTGTTGNAGGMSYAVCQRRRRSALYGSLF